jgi:hypothetical protein
MNGKTATRSLLRLPSLLPDTPVVPTDYTDIYDNPFILLYQEV